MTDIGTRYQELRNAGFSAAQVPIIDSIQQGTGVSVKAATATVIGGVLKSTTVATPAALTVTGTASSTTYSANEGTMINALKADITALRTSLVAVIANLKTAGTMA